MAQTPSASKAKEQKNVNVVPTTEDLYKADDSSPARKIERKELSIVSDQKYGLLTIKYSGGGELPAVLKTSFTHREDAQRAIDIYTSEKQKG